MPFAALGDGDKPEYTKGQKAGDYCLRFLVLLFGLFMIIAFGKFFTDAPFEPLFWLFTFSLMLYIPLGIASLGCQFRAPAQEIVRTPLAIAFACSVVLFFIFLMIFFPVLIPESFASTQVSF
jgi:hypothetical protein